MRKENVIILMVNLVVLSFFGCASKKDVSSSYKDSNTYNCKTYMYRWDSFAEENNSKIDTLNYTWRDSFVNGLLIQREYPKYAGEYLRIESYKYDKDDQLKKILVNSTIYGRQFKDSTIYNRIDLHTIEVIKYDREEHPFREIHRKVNDTLYVDQYLNGKYAFTSREFFESKTRKQSQIVEPEIHEVMNIYLYNNKEDLIGIERYENGNFVGKTMSIVYKYDSLNRIILKETYSGEGIEEVLSIKEIIIYE